MAALQSVFMGNWIKAWGVVLDGEDYFPALESAGDVACQVFYSSPTGAPSLMRLMFLLAITAAVRSIRIGTAYFIPVELFMGALLAVACASRRI